jgi:hypothetical protein
MSDQTNKQSQSNSERHAPPPMPEKRGGDEARQKTGAKDAPEQEAVIFSGAVNIYPRPPLDPSNFGLLDLSQAAGTEFLPGLPGMIVDTSLKDQFSLVPETDIPFSFVVAYGSDDYCKLATGVADKVVGVALYDATAPTQVISALSAGYYGYRAYEWAVRILRVGRMWALPASAVSRGEAATFDNTGALRGAGGNPISGAVWMSDASIGDLAIVQFNLYQ